MFSSSFKKLAETTDNSKFKKNINNLQPKWKKRIAKEKKEYDPRNLRISDDSDDQSTIVFRSKNKQAKLKLDTTLMKNIREKIDVRREVHIEWSSDEDSSKTARKGASGPTKFATAMANKEIPVKRREITQHCKNSATRNVVPAKRLSSCITSENDIAHWHFNESIVQNSFQGEFKQILQRDQFGVYANSHHNGKCSKDASNSNSTEELHSNYAEIKKHASHTKLRMKKGGYLEKLRKVLNSWDSDCVFWNHEREVGLAEPGCDAVVKSVIKSYGMAICSLDIQEKKIKVSLLNNNLQQFLSEGLKLKVCLEGQPFHVQGKDFYLSTNKICKI